MNKENRTSPDVPNIGFWTPFIILILGVVSGILMVIFLPRHVNNVGKTTTHETVNQCIIDAVLKTYNPDAIPSTRYTYHTKCGFTFSSKQELSIGDSVQVNTIVIENEINNKK